MDILSKIFGSEERVRIFRLFLFNPDSIFDVEIISSRTGASRRRVDAELSLMTKIGMARRKPYPKSMKDENGRRRRGNGWTLNKNFHYLKPLEVLLIQQILLDDSEMVRRLERVVSKLKMVIISGIFIQSEESRADLLVVGDNLRKSALSKVIKEWEAEIGKEIRYVAFETSEFQYRIGMYDKLLRDIADYPHRTIFDKITKSHES